MLATVLNEHAERLGGAARKARLDRSRNLCDVQTSTGIGVGRLSQIERGVSWPTGLEAASLADALGSAAVRDLWLEGEAAAGRAADDGEAITASWLAGHGFDLLVALTGKRELRQGDSVLVALTPPSGMGRRWRLEGWGPQANISPGWPRTRGDVRLMLRAMGVTLTPPG